MKLSYAKTAAMSSLMSPDMLDTERQIEYVDAITKFDVLLGVRLEKSDMDRAREMAAASLRPIGATIVEILESWLRIGLSGADWRNPSKNTREIMALLKEHKPGSIGFRDFDFDEWRIFEVVVKYECYGIPMTRERMMAAIRAAETTPYELGWILDAWLSQILLDRQLSRLESNIVEWAAEKLAEIERRKNGQIGKRQEKIFRKCFRNIGQRGQKQNGRRQNTNDDKAPWGNRNRNRKKNGRY